MKMLKIAILAALVVSMTGCSYKSKIILKPIESTWPDSAEFSQLSSGQERFSSHATNLDNVIILVDHSTGVEYIATSTGMSPLLNDDGTPVTVLEAG